MTDPKDDETLEEATPPEEKTPKPPQQPGKPSNDEEITPERYKGLQKVVAKRDAEIDALKLKLEELSTTQEEVRLKGATTEAEKAKLAKDLEDARKLLETATAEQQRATKKLAQQTIVLKQFPDLAPLAEFIPPADDDETFVKNAKSLTESLDAYIEARVKSKLSGAVPPVQPRSQDQLPDGEEDRLWAEVSRYAGVPGKEREFREANIKLQALLAAKTP